MKQDFHAFQGMRQDNHPIRQESKYLWEAHNIRFTAREDNTLLSMTNERGPKAIDNIEISGTYVGHCVVGDYLVVFTYNRTDIGNKSYNSIYRIIKDQKNDSWKIDLLCSDKLLMTPEHPLQTLGIYEGEFVQKVYWVDGQNQPRCINIVADKLLLGKDISKLSDADKEFIYPKGGFDFIKKLTLEEEVTVERNEGGGSFSSGTIQYAFSYYTKHGQETNLFYTTELYNTSFPNRGGSPEEAVSNTFHITIKHPETSFQYLRIYSIHRTSLNSTPIVKIVTDIEIDREVDDDTIVYVDTGLVGTDIDPTKMLYIGGESIIAGTITEKDNTLFLGNIELKRNNIPDNIKEAFRAAVEETAKEDITDKHLYIASREIHLKDIDDAESIYDYSNQLALGNTSTFKIGDRYRLGLQFQHITGKWSEPVWLGDYTIPRGIKPHREGDSILVPEIKLNLSKYESQINELKALDYKKVRALVVLPSIYDRMVLAQGILCPTVFSIKDRVNNTPFSQSSWFFRPMSKKDNQSTINIEKGATVTFEHLEPLKTTKLPIGNTSDRGVEIQNMVLKTFSEANQIAKKDSGTNLNTFFVDQSVLTLHSPDIEFDDSTKQALENNDFELDIVGFADFKSNAGDITIQTSSGVPAPNDNGFFHKSFLTTNYENRGIVAGLFYRSHALDDDTNTNIVTYLPKDSSKEYSWMVYPWHRSGSLNNDIVRKDGGGTRTAVLKRKVISNLRVSPDINWLDEVWSSEGNYQKGVNMDIKNGITPVSIFNSNEVSLIKIPTPKNSGIKAMNYYGNVDSLITAEEAVPFYVAEKVSEDSTENSFTTKSIKELSSVVSFVGDYQEQLKKTKDPVRMKYKSSPHAVFAFNYLNNNAPVILPSIKCYNKYTSYEINNYGDSSFADNAVPPFWTKSTLPAAPISFYTKAIYENVELREGTEAQIEQAVLNDLSEVPSFGDSYAICTCSAYPNDSTKADLYYNEGTLGSTWKKFNLKLATQKTCYRKDNYWIIEKDENNKYYLTLLDTSKYYFLRQDTIQYNKALKACLFVGELRRKEVPTNSFGGDTPEALRNNLWIPAGPPVNIDVNNTVEFIYGDTYYQRYDCLKTYPFTTEDENSVVEIASFMCESRINLDGRYDRNRGQISNLNMSPTNFNLMNPVYSQKDNFFNYRILDKEYYKSTKYPTQVLWSLEKSYLEDVDTWTNLTLANSIDLSGSAGPITSLETFNDVLLAFQEKAISQILFNSRVQIPASDGVPIEIANNNKVEGIRAINTTIGCQDKWAIAKSPSGLYFIDNTVDTLYLYNGQIQDISTQLGGKFWLRKYHSNNTWSITGTSAVRLSYDQKNKDLYLSPVGDTDNENTLCYSEQLGQFTSLMSYSNAVMFSIGNNFFSITSELGTPRKTKLWENFKGDYNMFFGKLKLPRFTYICNEDAAYTKIFDTIEYRADLYDENGELLHDKSFDWIEVTNEYQDTGKQTLTQSRRVFNNVSLRKKFRVWRSQIPRDNRARIRNPWASISLGFNESTEESNIFNFILHDISTKYTI